MLPVESVPGCGAAPPAPAGGSDVLQRDQHPQAPGPGGNDRLAQSMDDALLNAELNIHRVRGGITFAGRENSEQVGPVITVNVAQDYR